MSWMSCCCTKQTFIAHTIEGLKMLFPLDNFSSFQSNLMPGQNFFWLYVCTKKDRKSRELTVKDKPKVRWTKKYNVVFKHNCESNSHRKINDNRSQKHESFCSVWLLWIKGKVMGRLPFARKIRLEWNARNGTGFSRCGVSPSPRLLRLEENKWRLHLQRPMAGNEAEVHRVEWEFTNGTGFFRSFRLEREKRNTSEDFHLFQKLFGGMSSTIWVSNRNFRFLWTNGKRSMMSWQKEEIDHVLGTHKGAREHFVSLNRMNYGKER